MHYTGINTLNQKPYEKSLRGHGSSLNIHPNRNNYKYHNYLTESSCEQIQKALRLDYFKRLQSVSINKLQNNVVDNNEELKQRNINFEEINDRPMRYAAKQIMFSNKIRKDNYNWIKKHPGKIKNEDLDSNANQVFNNTEEYRDQVTASRKIDLPVIKKVVRDKNPIYYDLGYIDEVENKYIKPFLSKDNIIYTDFIENKRSKAPFNFYIG